MNPTHALSHRLRRFLPQIPSECAVCRGWGSQRVCMTCAHRFARPQPRCERCAMPTPEGTPLCGRCITHPPLFDAACAAVDYAFPWNRLLWQFKFHEGLDLLPVMGGLMAQSWQARAQRLATDLLLPVPLSESRLKERGFNQAWELSRRLAETAQAPSDPSLLLRIRDTPHQLSLDRTERSAAVRGAFAVDPLRRAALQGRTVTVVDDVMTTMATANEVAAVLKQAGAARVNWWCFARTPAASAAPN